MANLEPILRALVLLAFFVVSAFTVVETLFLIYHWMRYEGNNWKLLWMGIPYLGVSALLFYFMAQKLLVVFL